MNKDHEEPPWLTVITVVKDAPDDFRRTLASVAAQELSGVEYVVVDGSSDVRAITGILAERPEIQATYAWATPTGIYAAMTDGLERATGEYVFFANAGDVFHSPDVLDHVHGVIDSSQPAWLFGRVEILGIDGSRVITPAWDYEREKSASFSRGHFPSHQGTFARRALLVDQGGFDGRYTIAADYACFLRLSLVADPVQLDLVIATFAEGGVSTTQWQESFRQFHLARMLILRPHGWQAIREKLESARHFALVYAHREILGRLRGALR